MSVHATSQPTFSPPGSGPATHPAAFVLGLGVNGLGVVRALGRHGVSVVGLYTDLDEVGRGSRYCKAVRMPRRLDPAQRVRHLTELADRYQGRPVLFATSDASAQWVNDHQDVLRTHFRFHSVDPDLFGRLNTKLGIIDLTRQAGVDTPRTVVFEDLERFAQAAPDLPYPMLIKPVDTFEHTLPGAAKNERFEDRASLEAYVRRHPTYLRNMVFQEVIPAGDGLIYICTLLLNGESRVVMSYTGRKLRQYKPDYGVTCFGVSERIEELVATSSAFMQRVGYQGVCTLEFARDTNRDRYLFLEVNVRSYYHNQLFYDCGLNFPLAEYSLLTDTQAAVSAAPRQREGLYWLDLNRDAGTFYRKWRRRQIGIWAWIRSLFKARSFAVFARDDVLPSVYGTADLIWQTIRFVARGARMGKR